MNRIIKKLNCIVWAFLLLLSSFCVPSRAAVSIKTMDSTIGIVKANAINIAKEISKTEDADLCNLELGEMIPIYNIENSIVAYKVVVNCNNKRKVSIILSAIDVGQVIEYTEDEEDFLDIAQENLKRALGVGFSEQRLYYLGGLDYTIGIKREGKSEEYYDVTTESIQKTTRDNCLRNESIAKSSIPDSGEIITNPKKYIKDVEYSRSDNVPGYKQTYKKTSEFNARNHCSPTAATNMMLYWYHRNTNKYGKLLESGSWTVVFNKMHNYMKTTNKDGTSIPDIAPAYRRYFKEKGVLCDVSYNDGAAGGLNIAKEIDKDFPCHLNLKNHSAYDNHDVLALGYQIFYYKKSAAKDYDIFIRIADGWSSEPNRYVWGDCKGTWHYISVHMKA